MVNKIVICSILHDSVSFSVSSTIVYAITEGGCYHLKEQFSLNMPRTRNRFAENPLRAINGKMTEITWFRYKGDIGMKNVIGEKMVLDNIIDTTLNLSSSDTGSLKTHKFLIVMIISRQADISRIRRTRSVMFYLVKQLAFYLKIILLLQVQKV